MSVNVQAPPIVEERARLGPVDGAECGASLELP